MVPTDMPLAATTSAANRPIPSSASDSEFGKIAGVCSGNEGLGIGLPGEGYHGPGTKVDNLAASQYAESAGVLPFACLLSSQRV